MKVSQYLWDGHSRLDSLLGSSNSAQLVLAFGDRAALGREGLYQELQAGFSGAHILTSSSAGEINGTEVHDGKVVLTAIEFDKAQVRATSHHLSAELSRREAGHRIGQDLAGDDLALVLVVSDGQNVNGSELVAGLNEALSGKVPVVGGLAGDGANFQATLVGLDQLPGHGNVVAVGLYGKGLEIGFGSAGGWEAFGPERLVTSAAGNVLYKLDGKSALELYKSYLGDKAADLPASGLLFPLSIKVGERSTRMVRTLLAVDEATQALTFAGDVPEGANVRLMRATVDKLIDGAGDAAEQCMQGLTRKPQLAILISCVGRRLVMGQRAEEEVEEVAAAMEGATLCGFYSYGELSPSRDSQLCDLHNQTMTITTISEG
ncbi:MAG: FIST N-terminal domain-containing protein [Bacteroidia bacterium]